jgi:mannose-1-phosphate guanylyltransferase
MVGRDNIWVVCNIAHEALVKEHVSYAKIITEPCAKNTAAPIGVAAIKVMKDRPNSVMVVLSADAAVENEEALYSSIARAVEAARETEVLVTIGVPPTCPHTGYGYIRRGAEQRQKVYKVVRFFEKPNLERAVSYLEEGGFLWNTGMFAWRPEVLLSAIKTLLPDLAQGLEEVRRSNGDFQQVVSRMFPSFESISIDFGVLEHARNIVVAEAEPFGWNDVGSWDSWAQYSQEDKNGNRTIGDAVAVDSSNCIVRSSGRFVAALGCKDIVIVDSGDALLVCPRERAQDVKKIVEELKARGRKELL